MTDRHLDDAIDRAVREMMNVDADPAFRARVFARLERAPRGGGSWLRTIVLAGMAAAAVLLAVVLMRTPAPAPAEKQVASSQPPAANAPTPGPVPVPAATGVPQVAIRDDERGALPRRSRRSAPARIETPNVTQSLRAGSLVATVAEPDASVADVPNESLDPIAVPLLQPSSIAPPPIVIAPLPPIAAIDIAPLSPQRRRD